MIQPLPPSRRIPAVRGVLRPVCRGCAAGVSDLLHATPQPRAVPCVGVPPAVSERAGAVDRPDDASNRRRVAVATAVRVRSARSPMLQSSSDRAQPRDHSCREPPPPPPGRAASWLDGEHKSRALFGASSLCLSRQTLLGRPSGRGTPLTSCHTPDNSPQGDKRWAAWCGLQLIASACSRRQLAHSVSSAPRTLHAHHTNQQCCTRWV